MPFSHGVEIGLLIGGYALALILIPRVVLSRRESAATLSWIVVLAAFPYVGALAYWLFGTYRLRRQTRRRRLVTRALARTLAAERERRKASHEPPLHASDRDMAVMLAELSGVAPIPGNGVRVFADPDAATTAMVEAIDGAKESVHFEVYIFKNDESGRLFRDRLAAAAARGVNVRLLVDDVGSLFTRSRFFAPIVAAGGQVTRFLPVSLWRGLYHANLRNHRKVLVVDGKLGFTGGLNVGDEYGGMRRRRVGPWRDTHVELRGPAVASLQEIFFEDWAYATGADLDVDRAFPPADTEGTHLVQVVPSGPDSEWEAIHHAIFMTVTRARDHVYLTTPYFVPDRALLVALQTAALRGVDVRLLVPARIDHVLIQAAARYHYTELLRAGIRVFEYQAGMLHAKTVEVDDHWTTIGSANLDLRSFRLNFELNVILYGRDIASEVKALFLRDLEKSVEFTAADLAAWRWPQRMAHASARLLEGIL